MVCFYDYYHLHLIQLIFKHFNTVTAIDTRDNHRFTLDFLLLSLQFTMTRIRSPLCLQTQALRLILTLCLTIGVVGRVLKNVVRCSSSWSARLWTGAEQCFRSVKSMNFSPFLLLTCQGAVSLHSLYFLFLLFASLDNP